MIQVVERVRGKQAMSLEEGVQCRSCPEAQQTTQSACVRRPSRNSSTASASSTRRGKRSRVQGWEGALCAVPTIPSAEKWAHHRARAFARPDGVTHPATDVGPAGRPQGAPLHYVDCVGATLVVALLPRPGIDPTIQPGFAELPACCSGPRSMKSSTKMTLLLSCRNAPSTSR